jgi:hypothetical protein
MHAVYMDADSTQFSGVFCLLGPADPVDVDFAGVVEIRLGKY